MGPQEPEPAPEANDPAPPAGDCGQIDYLGVCEQDTVVWCQGGQLSRLNCADLQQTCGWIDDSSGNYCVDDPTRAPSPESETPEAPDDGCGDIDHNGVCEGDVAVWCSGGSLRRFDCRTERQQTCAWIDDTLGNYCVDDSSPEQAPEQVPPAEPDPEPIAPQDECGGLGYEGRCDGDIAVWCSSGTLQTVDCMQTLGQSCGWAGDDVGFYCLEPAAPQDPQDPPPGDPPADACGGLDFLGECAGDIARYCEFGQIREVDCAQSESTCGWIDDQTGHYCQ